MKLTNYREATNIESSIKSKMEFKPMIYQPQFFSEKNGRRH